MYTTLLKNQEALFDFYIYISYLLIILSVLGLSVLNPSYINDLNMYVRIYICLYLIWRFNPFRTKCGFTDLDRKIAYSAGIFILTTTFLNNYIVDITNQITNFSKKSV